MNYHACMKIGGAQIAIDFSYNEGFAPMATEKIKILGAVLELPAKQHCSAVPESLYSFRFRFYQIFGLFLRL